jgi:protein disulfide-isomerase A1
MMCYRLLAVLALYIVASAIADDVVVGDEKNFDGILKGSTYVLAEFYAPWCGHCKNLEPEYSRAATTLKNLPNLKVVKVDATTERELGEKYSVQGYPTLKWFKNGEASDFNGGRDHDSIVAWVRKKTGPPSRKLTDQASLDTFAKEGDAVLVGLFKEGDAEFAEYEKAAGSLDDIQSAHTNDEDVIAKYAPAKVIMLQNFDNKVAKYDGKVEAEAIKDFAASNSMPLVVTFTQVTQGKIFGEAAPKRHLLALHSEGYSDKATLVDELTRVAKNFRGKLLVITVEKTTDNEGVFNFFSVVDATKPKIVSIDQSKAGMKKFFYDGEVKHVALQAWMDDILAGKISPSLKSEEPPTDNNAAVKVIVGKTFKEQVIDSGKDVFVEFYAPWCGHCKALAPELEKLGEEFKNVNSVLIGKMDSTANEVEEVEIAGFPTLYFWKAGDKIPTKYDGGRTQADMSKFIRENAGSNLKEGASGDKKEL